jgi:hypothetical protein
LQRDLVAFTENKPDNVEISKILFGNSIVVPFDVPDQSLIKMINSCPSSTIQKSLPVDYIYYLPDSENITTLRRKKLVVNSSGHLILSIETFDVTATQSMFEIKGICLFNFKIKL